MQMMRLAAPALISAATPARSKLGSSAGLACGVVAATPINASSAARLAAQQRRPGRLLRRQEMAGRFVALHAASHQGHLCIFRHRQHLLEAGDDGQQVPLLVLLHAASAVQAGLGHAGMTAASMLAWAVSAAAQARRTSCTAKPTELLE